MMGTIANSALKRLETRDVHETEPRELAEFHGIIGASKPIKEVYSQIQMAARNVATVLIEGESGTGKELVAKAIHAAGPRAKEPFVAVDCGAIPETLIEAELFGSKKGSYTGAIADRAGICPSHLQVAVRRRQCHVARLLAGHPDRRSSGAARPHRRGSGKMGSAGK